MVVALSGGPCEHVALSSPTTLVGAAFDSAFNLRARFYFWARRGQGDPRPRGRSIEGPGCPPGPSEHRFPSSTWERVPWAPRVVGCGSLPGWLSGLPVGLPPIWDPKSGLLGERVTGAWPWPGRPLCGLAAALPTPHSPVVHAQGCRVQTSPGDKRLLLELVPTWSGIQPPWASVPPPPPPEPMCGMQGGGGCCPSLNIQEPGPAFSLFMPLG